MVKSPLATETYPADEGNFTYGRSGRNIEAVTIHHMAGRLTAQQCGAIFQRPGRYGSSHYGIGYNGEIACYVGEENTAWTNSNWDSNCKSVTIETSDNDNSWYVNDTTLNSLIRLVADIAKRNNLGKLVRGKNLTWHCMFVDTDCPGAYLLSKIDYIIDQANKINEDVILKYEQIEKKSVILNKDANLWNLHFSRWDDAKSVKSFAKGTQIDNIVAIATHPLGSKYYITEYSYSNHIDNGFNVVDCDDIVSEPIEVPTEPPIEEPNNGDSEPKYEDNTNTPTEPNNDDSKKENLIRRLVNLIVEFFAKLFKHKTKK